jgi:Cu-processing system permease protein
VGRAAYYLLPDLERLNYRPHATYGVVPALSELLPSVGYAAAYTGVLVTLAVLLFNRRDFR